MTPTVSTTTRSTTPSRHPHPNPRRGAHPRVSHTPPPTTSAATRPMRALDAGPNTPRQVEDLWSMTAQQRVQAMYDGQLTLGQLTAWSGRRPNEVPRIAGEYAYIAMFDADWCEPGTTGEPA